MPSTLGGDSKSRVKKDDFSVSDSASTVADDSRGVRGNDYLPFIWQKLESMDNRLGEMSEKYGQLVERTTNLSAKVDQAALDAASTKEIVKSVKIYGLAIITIIGLIFAAYQLIESHISISFK